MKTLIQNKYANLRVFKANRGSKKTMPITLKIYDNSNKKKKEEEEEVKPPVMLVYSPK